MWAYARPLQIDIPYGLADKEGSGRVRRSLHDRRPHLHLRGKGLKISGFVHIACLVSVIGGGELMIGD